MLSVESLSSHKYLPSRSCGCLQLYETQSASIKQFTSQALGNPISSLLNTWLSKKKLWTEGFIFTSRQSSGNEIKEFRAPSLTSESRKVEQKKKDAMVFKFTPKLWSAKDLSLLWFNETFEYFSKTWEINISTNSKNSFRGRTSFISTTTTILGFQCSFYDWLLVEKEFLKRIMYK